MRLRKLDIGKICSVRYDDIGRITGLLVDFDEHRASVFMPFDGVERVDKDQIVELHRRIQFGI